MSDESPDANETELPFDGSDADEPPSVPLDESPYEVQPLDVEEKSFDREGFETRGD